jgi:hypothetical protein
MLAIVTGRIGVRADICVLPPAHLNNFHFQATEAVFPLRTTGPIVGN